MIAATLGIHVVGCEAGISVFALNASYYVAQMADGQNDLTKRISEVQDMLSKKGIILLVINLRDPENMVHAAGAVSEADTPKRDTLTLSCVAKSFNDARAFTSAGKSGLMGVAGGTANTLLGVLAIATIANIMNPAGGPGYDPRVCMEAITVIAMLVRSGSRGFKQ